MKVSLVTTQPPAPALAFGLLPQPKALPSVQVVGGSPGGLADLHGLTAFLTASHIRTNLVVPAISMPLLPTVSKELSGSRLHQGSDDDDISIVGPGLKLNSDTQIMLDKWLPLAGSVILTHDMLGLLKVNPSLSDVRRLHWTIDLPGLVKMASSTGRKALLTSNGGVYNVARIMAAQAIPADWFAVYTHAHVYIWLPTEELLLHAPIAEAIDEQTIRNGLLSLVLSLIYRRLSALDLETRWRVALWVLQSLQPTLEASQQVSAFANTLESAAQQ